MQDNLDKKTFWNPLYEKYPQAVQIFCDWIDKYKAKNNWNELFRCGEQFEPMTIKFHDLPLEMQVGILFQFCIDQGGCSLPIDLMEFDAKEYFQGYFETLQEFINEQKQL